MSKYLETIKMFEQFNTERNRVEYNFGTKRATEVVQAVFMHSGTVESIKPSCGGCTDARCDDGKIFVNLKLKEAIGENNAKKPGKYLVTKNVEFWMVDGQPDYNLDAGRNRITNINKMHGHLYLVGEVIV